MTVLLIAGVLVFAKTRVTPPSFVKLEDPFPEALQKSTTEFEGIADFPTSSKAYVAIDDKIIRFRAEDAIDDKMADDARRKIDTRYGKLMTDYGFSLFRKSVWDEGAINNLLLSMNHLAADRLSNGQQAVGSDFVAASKDINGIVSKYHEALALSRSAGYTSAGDAAAKIQKAKNYAGMEYLKNNASLVSALNAMPKRLADAHYNHVKGIVSSLNGYRSTSRDHFVNTLVPRADQAIKEYKNATVYGSNKQSIAAVEQQAVDIVDRALDFYDGY